MTIVNRPAWWDDAACRGEPLSKFFPPPTVSNRPAKQVCARCPVIGECAEWAESFDRTLSGVFAGLSSHERRYAKSARR